MKKKIFLYNAVVTKNFTFSDLEKGEVNRTDDHSYTFSHPFLETKEGQSCEWEIYLPLSQHYSFLAGKQVKYHIFPVEEIIVEYRVQETNGRQTNLIGSADIDYAGLIKEFAAYIKDDFFLISPEGKPVRYEEL